MVRLDSGAAVVTPIFLCLSNFLFFASFCRNGWPERWLPIYINTLSLANWKGERGSWELLDEQKES